MAAGGKQHERAQAPSEGGIGAVSPRLLGCSCLSASACIAEMSQGYKYTIKCAVPSSATDPAGTTEPIPIL